MHTRALLGALLVSALATAGCGGGTSEAEAPPASEPRRGGTLVLGSISDVDSWNEYLSRQAFAASLGRRMFLWLARERPAAPGEPPAYEPQLAESWSFSDDGLALTFRLRPASWSDGRPITARDVRFTWQAQTSPELPWAEAASKSHITDVEVVDDRTVIFRFDRRYPYQLADAVEGGILAEHVHGAVPLDRWASHDWSQARVASGPFLLESHEPGHEIVMVRNPRYFRDDRPRVDRLVVRIVPDAQNLLAQLRAGDIDYMEGVAPRDAERLAGRDGISVVAYDAPQFDYLGWNGSRPPFADPELRRAMTLALDREALVEDLLHGRGRVSRGPILSWRWGAAPLEAWSHDPDEARRILESRGFATDRAARGKPLSITLLTNAGNPLRQDALLKVQEQLSRIGVRAQVEPMEMRAMRERISSGDYDGYLGGWVFYGRVDLRSLFGSSATPPDGTNVVFYRSTEVDRLLDELDAARTAAEAEPLLVAIQREIHADQPYTFLYENARIAAHGPRLHGVSAERVTDTLASLEDWWLD